MQIRREGHSPHSPEEQNEILPTQKQAALINGDDPRKQNDDHVPGEAASKLLHMNDADLYERVAFLQQQRNDLDRALLQLGSALYYRAMLDEGWSASRVTEFMDEDRQMLDRSLAYKASFNGLRSTFFGYPGNLNTDSPLVRRLRKEEAEMYYSNDCGDPYETGNVSMDGKEFEQEILRLFYRKFGVEEATGWGYVTSGGTESNTWGIRNGFRLFPKGRLYFCEAAHYSVEKSVSNGERTIFPYTIIPQTSPRSERIHRSKLLETAKRNFKERGEAAILLLTWGTTKLGSLDDVVDITTDLKREGIPYYLHVDAAFYGGIPANQQEAPICPTLGELGADSVSVSLHKFFGVPTINSVVISKDKAYGKEISYIGQRDTTVSGSRTFPVFSAYQRIREILERSPMDYYIRNVRIFEKLLMGANVKYFRDGHANIFVFPRPSDDILKKYQLSSFEGPDGRISLAHVIVNPFHTRQELEEIFDDIKADQELFHREFEFNKWHDH